MNNTNLIFFKFTELYQIFEELNDFFKLKIKKINSVDELNQQLKELEDYLVITKDSNLEINNQIILKDFPIEFNKLLEKINITILKNSFSKKSNIKVGNYKIDLNSKEISIENKLLKLTEKEIKMIIYLSKSTKSVPINELQKNIWGYGVDLETHTVETHVHRLRSKMLNIFDDKNFITSTKNGYKIF
tara:strand:- start:5457 stop:6020 length:564 start_codon:yes stop_codon:yes gene_type:complete